MNLRPAGDESGRRVIDPSRSVLVRLLLAGVSSGCVAGTDPGETTSAITDGSLTEEDPAVVGLGRWQQATCTGVVVAPRVLLTAAHCIGSDPPAWAFFGAAIDRPGRYLTIVDARVHPAYEPSTLSRDVGLLLLEEPVEVPPIPIDGDPLDDSVLGRAVRVLGFGATGSDSYVPSSRREGLAIIEALTADEIALSAGPNQICTGDSGGPTLLSDGGREWLVGIHSSGDAGCRSSAWDVRLDAVLDDFVRPHLDPAAWDAPRGPAGCGVGGDSSPPLTTWSVVLLLAWLRAWRPMCAHRA